MGEGVALRVRDLEVRTVHGRRLLSVPALDVAPGEAVVVRGPSGAGKSTLLYAISGLLPTATGSVHWNDLELSAASEAQRASFRSRNLGFIFQDHLLFEELSAEENASLAAAYAPKSMRDDLREVGSAMLSKLGVGGKGRQPIASFSGGERQRVAVARALAGNPAVILADEPTASLDRPTADSLIDDLLALAREGKRTLIVVSHDTALHDRADRLIEVLDGVLTEVSEDA